VGEKEVRPDAVINVGVLAVGLSRNPATDYCLGIIEDAVRGRIRALYAPPGKHLQMGGCDDLKYLFSSMLFRLMLGELEVMTDGRLG